MPSVVLTPKTEFIDRNYGRHRRFDTMISEELDKEPIQYVISVDAGLEDFLAMLRSKGYDRYFLARFPLSMAYNIKWSRGEDLSEVRIYPKDMDGNNQTHLKGWYVPSGSDSGMHSTVHAEKSPREAVKTLEGIKSHLLKGKGDYIAGTERFLKEDLGYGDFIEPTSFTISENGLWVPENRSTTAPPA